MTPLNSIAVFEKLETSVCLGVFVFLCFYARAFHGTSYFGPFSSQLHLNLLPFYIIEATKYLHISMMTLISVTHTELNSHLLPISFNKQVNMCECYMSVSFETCKGILLMNNDRKVHNSSFGWYCC